VGTTANPRFLFNFLGRYLQSLLLPQFLRERGNGKTHYARLTITIFLRVGLRWFYLPNASPKQIPNTSFSLILKNNFHPNGPVFRGCLPPAIMIATRSKGAEKERHKG
jgi:hypothetical protein